jgi:folate-dependent phosphoribosylglycinamide formyltransferase PurN
MLEQVVHRQRNVHAGFTEEQHLRAAAEWLERAQEATGDNGVSGRFFLKTGWSSSDPERSGYVIPTFIALADALGEDRFRERASRCVDFLASVQLESGAFPGGEVHENRTRPSVFETAQILHGLVQFHVATGDSRARKMATRAADWLVAQQDEDGAFRKHAYNELPVTYSAHASCWIAEAGEALREPRWLQSASAHLEWVLAQRDPETGWFNRISFDARDAGEDVAFTHTIAYTLWGVLHSSVIFGREDGIGMVRQAARAVARRLELSRRLPALLDRAWRSRASSTCLTGNAQMALIWLRLHAMQPDFQLMNAALKALDDAKAAQPMTHWHPGIRGGIPGSDPLWGDYLPFALPNWSAKYFIDALLAKRKALAAVPQRPREKWDIPSDLPQRLPPNTLASGRPMRTVLYTRDGSHKVPRMMAAWAAWEFRPAAVVIETPPAPGFVQRVRKRLRSDGLAPLVRRLLQGPTIFAAASHSGDNEVQHDIARFCAARRIPVVHVGKLDDPAAITAVRNLRPDLAVVAGAGILRAPLLAVPRLGTLNAHMGILPRFRGINVTAWARFLGSVVGCTVHVVDSGIDTGDILCVRRSEGAGARTIAELREYVDRDQTALLGEVIRWIQNAGTLPPTRTQRLDEGTQFFSMHQDLRAVLDGELAATIEPPVDFMATIPMRAEFPAAPIATLSSSRAR